MDTEIRFVVQGARARTAAAESMTPTAPAVRHFGGARHQDNARGTLTPDLLRLNPPTNLALSPAQALSLRRYRS